MSYVILIYFNFSAGKKNILKVDEATFGYLLSHVAKKVKRNDSPLKKSLETTDEKEKKLKTNPLRERLKGHAN